MRETTSQRQNRRFKRRQFLAGSAAAGFAAVAGCMGDDDADEIENGLGNGNGNGNGNGATEETEDGVFYSTEFEVPTDAQFNPYGVGNIPDVAMDVANDLLAYFDASSLEFVEGIVEDWTTEDESMEITIRDDYVWHDGDDFTAEDVRTKILLDVYMDYEPSAFVEDVEVVDDTTVELHLLEETNPDVLEQTILETRMDTKTSVYGDYLSAMEDAREDDDEDAFEDAQGELLDWSHEETVGNGPFEITDIDQNRFLLERFSDHPYADELNFDRWEIVHASDDQERWARLISGEGDGEGIMGVPPEVEAEFPSEVQTYEEAGHGGQVVLYNHDADYMDQREVRQALAFAYDRFSAGESGFHEETVEVPLVTGFSPDFVDEYIGDRADDYIQYESDQDRATELLEEAGFELDGDEWYTPDGDRFSLTVSVVAGWPDSINKMQYISETLDGFGIETELLQVDQSAFWADHIPNQAYDITMNWWGGANPHPYFSLYEVFVSGDIEYSGYPDEVEIPPIGEPDGPTETVVPADLLSELAQTTDEEEERELIQELAWIYNYDLPSHQVFQRNARFFINNEDWNVPEEDHPLMLQGGAPHNLPALGEIQYNE